MDIPMELAIILPNTCQSDYIKHSTSTKPSERGQLHIYTLGSPRLVVGILFQALQSSILSYIPLILSSYRLVFLTSQPLYSLNHRS